MHILNGATGPFFDYLGESLINKSAVLMYHSTYPIIVFNVDISSCLDNEICGVIVAFSSCHVQGCSLKEIKETI